MKELELKQLLVQIGESVEPYINELLTDSVEEQTHEQALYQCQVGGKRIRPALVYLSGKIFDANEKDLMSAAASIEILHNSTLIADDIIDHSEFRRNQPTCWKKYGRSFAECQILNYVASIPLGLVNIKNGDKIIELYGRTLKIVVEGEIKDILFERSGRQDEPYEVANRYRTITHDDYFQMVSQKTAALLEACCRAGAIIANTSDENINALGDFGHNIGMAFQIQDDILDIFADEKEFGKKIGKDIIEKKLGNFVILSAIEELDDDSKNRILSVLDSTNEATDEIVSEIISIINTTSAKKTAQDMADKFIKLAQKALDAISQNEYTEKLRQIAEYIVERKS